MTDRLPPSLEVPAVIRSAAIQGINITILHKGDPDNGALLLKINKLDGTALLFHQVTLNDGRAWMATTTDPALPDREVDSLVAEQIHGDPDLWAIEIEDREGRLWFEGAIIK